MMTVLKFNWPKYVLGLAAAVGLLFVAGTQDRPLNVLLSLAAGGTIYLIASSLLASWYVYDLRRVGSFEWMESLLPDPSSIASVHLGYDYALPGLQRWSSKSGASCQVESLLFRAHETPSSRGRSLARAVPSSETVLGLTTIDEALARGAQYDLVVLGFSAHEARDRDERLALLRQCADLVALDGCAVLVEHTLDARNLAAFGPWAFHFYRTASWVADVEASGFSIEKTQRVAGLVTAFTLTSRPRRAAATDNTA